MMEYMKPMIVGNEELAEGVYAASGSDTPKCDSKYMNGVYAAPQYNTWNNPMKEHYGCLGCPAFTETACGLQTHYVNSGQAGSYDADAGKRMPGWEQKGHTEDEIVNENNMWS
jgi:hypothetical protein